MHKVLVTFLPKTPDDKSYMDIEEFPNLPVVGDFLTFGKNEAFEVLQVVHCLGQSEKTFSVTVSSKPLPHAAFLKSEESRDNQPTA
jgi:hypothetical protein